jgi:hypothetical protein
MSTAIKGFRLALDITAHIHMLRREVELMPSKLSVGDAKWMRQIFLGRARQLAESIEQMAALLEMEDKGWERRRESGTDT